ncbi:MAG: sugar ABC transporter substrate-binding protein, partial [Proteobacteria bacterium]|nr:sugar ABC transporter substrate-binding protein [Pseudomonadota bacterium]
MALRHLFAGAAMLVASTGLASAATITIATVNNGDMIKMQKLAPQWEKATGNKINWVVLEENVLRQRVTTDIATKGGQFDILTIGSYETPIWGKQGWLVPLDFPASYDIKDVFPGVRDALSANGKLYAAPFYAESSFTLYRKDLFDKAGLTMPAKPTYDEIAKFADKLTDKSKGQYGVCLRGKAGWGENMALVDTLVNGFGGQWFNMKWDAEIDTPAWHNALNWYVDLMHRDGPPGATSNGFNENLALFTTGHCAIWIDATSAAGLVYDKNTSQVWDKTAFTAAPHGVTANGTGWFWAWAMAIPTTSKQQDVAKSFLAWSTSKEYIDLVGKTFGYTVLPPGTRISTYANPEYIK